MLMYFVRLSGRVCLETYVWDATVCDDIAPRIPRPAITDHTPKVGPIEYRMPENMEINKLMTKTSLKGRLLTHTPNVPIESILPTAKMAMHKP